MRSLRCALLDPSAAREARSSRAGSGTPTGARAAQEPSVRRQRVTLSVSPSTPRALFLAVSALMMAAEGGRYRRYGSFEVAQPRLRTFSPVRRRIFLPADTFPVAVAVTLAVH
jgi:hypothetical protein